MQRRAEIETLARALARSGRYRGHVAVVASLKGNGYPEAVKLFQNPWQQAEIDRICAAALSAARRKKSGLPGNDGPAAAGTSG